MIEYINNRLCVPASLIFQAYNRNGVEYDPIMSYDAFTKRTRRISRNKIHVAQKACRGRECYVFFDSLPFDISQAIVSRIGDPYKLNKSNVLFGFISPDPKAATFFSSHQKPDGGRLKPDRAIQLQTEAEILNAIQSMVSDVKGRRAALGSKKGQKAIWPSILEMLGELPDKGYNHKLPTNERTLRIKIERYNKEGYASLINKNEGNSNARKVTEGIERLILSLYRHQNKPYSSWVYEDYLSFLAGNLEVVDTKTGEILQPEDFFNENGEPVLISKQKVWEIINDPKNRPVVDALRNGAMTYQDMHRPHMHRHAPKFSLSKISLDDRDLPRKMLNGKRVKAYYAYDVCSGAVIGAAYSKLKDNDLFLACIRDMFFNLNRLGLGMPQEMEVEHHIVKNFEHDLMKAGVLFPFVRWCKAGNSQEKSAEHFNKSKKYGYEKRYQENIGRFYSKLEANKTRSEKVFNEENDEYREKKYPYDDLVADDKAIIEKYNNGLHPDQKKYSGMSRMDVLVNHSFPNTAEIDPALLNRYIGELTKTSITRNQYVRVQQMKFVLPDVKVLARLEANNYEVDAFWMYDEGNDIPQVYLYQNGNFICAAKQLKTFGRAQVEWDDTDKEAYKEQGEYVGKFDAMVKKGKEDLYKPRLRQITQEKTFVRPEPVPEQVETEQTKEVKPDSKSMAAFYAARAMESL